MPSMRDIKEKIASTKQMRKITKAMQMVAAAKLTRSQESAQLYEAYAAKLREIATDIAATLPPDSEDLHPMLATRPVKKTGYLILTESKGLAGAYDANVLKYAQQLINRNHQSKNDYTIVVTGKVGTRFFEKRNYAVAFSKTDIPEEFRFEDVADFAGRVVDLFEDREIDELHLIYNHFVNAITQTVVDKQLLPLTNFQQAKKPAKITVPYAFEPSVSDVLDALLPLFAEGQVYGALLDAKAAEYAARTTAMRNASDNASDIIDHLSLSYNRARQAHITQEITEIVGGATALE
ncbi:MAG: ATP synthase F1 subunit gamma [Sporolactobacillus sp.]|nr:ATP synthase F1 subunit gamma [Sporolactobacillus sp.]